MRKRKVLRQCLWRICYFTTPGFRLGGAGIASRCAGWVAVARLWFVLDDGSGARPCKSKRRGIGIAQAKRQDQGVADEGECNQVKNGARRLILESRDKARVNTLASSGDDEEGLSSSWSWRQSWENIAVGKVRERQSFKSRAHEFCTPLVRLAASAYPITSPHAHY